MRSGPLLPCSKPSDFSVIIYEFPLLRCFSLLERVKGCFERLIHFLSFIVPRHSSSAVSSSSRVPQAYPQHPIYIDLKPQQQSWDYSNLQQSVSSAQQYHQPQPSTMRSMPTMPSPSSVVPMASAHLGKTHAIRLAYPRTFAVRQTSNV